ncbi:MAG: hypothetical protein ACRDT6_05340 [Micromonosporaceae bacterium]
MAAHNGYRNIHSVDLYPATGTTEDWAYGALGALGYTFEHGSDEQFFHPPYAGNMPGYYEKNREPFLLMAEAAINPEHHGILRVRVTDAAGSPVTASLRLQRATQTPTWSGTHDDPLDVTTATGADGHLDWHVNPSQTPPAKEQGTAQSYTLTVTAAGGTPVTRTVSVDRGQVTTVDVTA